MTREALARKTAEATAIPRALAGRQWFKWKGTQTHSNSMPPTCQGPQTHRNSNDINRQQWAAAELTQSDGKSSGNKREATSGQHPHQQSGEPMRPPQPNQVVPAAYGTHIMH